MKFCLSIIILLLSFVIKTFGQGPEVPSHLQFADISLHIKDGARKQIQADVDALQRNRSYFERRLEKVDLYFPIIERVLKEENVPDDFKYLVIQESALVPDAVSSSNAVGFWQFKEQTAEEVGLRVDRNVDERMNIVSATRGAARYLKKNNFYNNNWLMSLLAYMTGQGGVESHIDARFRGAKKMDIDTKTHWYIKKFLAYKIAFQDEVGRNENLPYHLQEYTRGADKTLKDISGEFMVDSDLLEGYNKWLKHGRIPSDKTYAVLVPIELDNLVAREKVTETEKKADKEIKTGGTFVTDHGTSIDNYDLKEEGTFPRIKDKGYEFPKDINGLPGIVAKAGETAQMLADKGDVSLKRFLKYNDLNSNEKIVPGQVYYFKKKHAKAKVHYHVARPGETMWEISQVYGVKLHKLMMKNRMDNEQDLRAGRVLWMRFIRPASIPIEYKEYAKPSEAPQATQTLVKSQPNKVENTPAKKEPELTREETFDFDEGTIDMSDVDQNQENPATQQEASDDDYFDDDNYVDLQSSGNNKVQEPAVSNTPSESPNTTTGMHSVHVVAQGETLFSIARQYGVTIQEITQWNNLDQNIPLKIGQELRVIQPTVEEHASSGQASTTPPDQQPGEFIVHKVASNETLYSIARKYNVSIKQLMEWNNKEDFNIKIDEELRIKKN